MIIRYLYTFFLKIENKEVVQLSKNGEHINENTIDTTAELWVQKYKPNRYMDLLSDESTNRILLNWLKLWDKVVFNKEVIRKRKTTLDVYDKTTGKLKKNNLYIFTFSNVCLIRFYL